MTPPKGRLKLKERGTICMEPAQPGTAHPLMRYSGACHMRQQPGGLPVAKPSGPAWLPIHRDRPVAAVVPPGSGIRVAPLPCRFHARRARVVSMLSAECRTGPRTTAGRVSPSPKKTGLFALADIILVGSSC
jgi:hypothetical protein